MMKLLEIYRTIHDGRNNRKPQASELLLRPQTSGWVGHLDTQNLGPKTKHEPKEVFGMCKFADAPFQDDSSVAAAHVVSDLSGIFTVVHQQQVDFPDVVDQELL
jgi:hypothetical protein